MIKSLIFTIVAILPVSYLTDYTWSQDLKEIHREFTSCSASGNTEDCRMYIGKAFSVVYGIKDFRGNGSNEFMDAGQIGSFVSNSGEWELLGAAYDEKVLTKSQALANANKAVLALYKNAQGETMHVAIILPGDLIPSGSWGVQVPNSASLPTFDPDHSFINKGLSYAFEKRMLLNVKIYARI